MPAPDSRSNSLSPIAITNTAGVIAASTLRAISARTKRYPAEFDALPCGFPAPAPVPSRYSPELRGSTNLAFLIHKRNPSYEAKFFISDGFNGV